MRSSGLPSGSGSRSSTRRHGPARTNAAGAATGSTALLDQTATFYERYLWDSQAGSLARDYLAGRGLREEICREFRLGLALGGTTLGAQGRWRRASPPTSCARRG